MLKKDEIMEQSRRAYGQWCDQWRDHARQHSRHPQIKNSLQELEGIGYGRAILAIGNGATLEDNIDVLREEQEHCDTICCDKTIGALLDHGVRPTYCIVMDANVNYERYMEPWKDKLEDTTLIMNVCANPEWSFNGNWKQIYFTVQRDVMKNEIEFSSLSTCANQIPAGTNVSNAAIVFLTQCDERGPRNHLGYDKILLLGYDYCWRRGRYYAWAPTGDGKDNYMRHISALSLDGDYVYTSTNLHFSARWMKDYINVYKILAIQCGKTSLLRGAKQGELRQQMRYNMDKDIRRFNMHKHLLNLRTTEAQMERQRAIIVAAAEKQRRLAVASI